MDEIERLKKKAIEVEHTYGVREAMHIWGEIRKKQKDLLWKKRNSIIQD